jgi:hypothetical protein
MAFHTSPAKELQRYRPGTSYAQFRSVDLVSTQLVGEESFGGSNPFGAQDVLQQMIRLDKDNLQLLTRTPKGCDPLVWQYEHLRYFQLCAPVVFPVMKC